MKICELLETLDIQNLNEFRPDPGTHVVLVTGKMAYPGLKRMMSAINPVDFSYEIRVLDLEIAAWLTAEKIIAEFGDTSGVDLILVPGKTTGSELEVEQKLGIKTMKGPGCYSELPVFLEEEGIELEVSGVPKPKILAIGPDASIFANFLAKTYEVPLITVDELVNRAKEDGVVTGDPYRHNFLAELVRARLIESDAKQGFAILGYPRTARDYVWFKEMKTKPDKILIAGNIDDDLKLELSKDVSVTYVSTSSGEQDMLVFALKSVEEAMQQCVIPDAGYAKKEKQ